jgi:hypothetical protein
MADLGTSSGIKKLNSHNYGYWKTCIESYLQGQDLWEVVAGSEVVPPAKETDQGEPLRKWKIKAGKAMFVLKTTIEEDLLEHIREADTPKTAWETLEKLFSKKNEARLQLLDNELAGISQGTLTISQYFTKVKSICREISQLQPEEKISEARMKRIIIHGLRPEYSGFIAAVRGWPNQPSLVELENLLVNQEKLAKQMGSITEKEEEEALFTSKKKGSFRRQERFKPKWTDGDKYHAKERSPSLGGARGREDKKYQPKKKNGGCFNCGKAGHFARDCRLPKRCFERNIATTIKEEKKEEAPNGEEEWDIEAGFSQEVEDNELEEDMEVPAFAATIDPKIDYKEDWIIDSGCSNHMTNDDKKLEDMTDYKGGREVLIADNSRLAISHVGKTTIPRYGPHQLQLNKVYHILGLKKNLLSVSQLTEEGKYILFGLEGVSIYRKVKVIGTPILEGKRRQSVYVLSAESAYVDKTRRSETGDLWHARLGHVNYRKLKEMMQKQVLKGLPQMDIRIDTVCAGC